MSVTGTGSLRKKKWICNALSGHDSFDFHSESLRTKLKYIQNSQKKIAFIYAPLASYILKAHILYLIINNGFHVSSVGFMNICIYMKLYISKNRTHKSRRGKI